MADVTTEIEKDKMTILSLSWRDIRSPKSGGAEVHTHEMLSKINHDKYQVVHIAPKYNDLPEQEVIDGVNYLRMGNVLSVIPSAFFYYKKNKKKIDFVIDQCNTHRFFTPLWVKKSKRIFYIHQLTREIWDINLSFPFSKIGKILETPLLKMNKNDFTITVSNSTKKDLLDIGFQEPKIGIIPNIMKFEPWDKKDFLNKYEKDTFVYVGRYVPYKGIDAAIEAFGELKKRKSNIRLLLLGKRNEAYIKDYLIPICEKYELTYSYGVNEADVDFCGFVSEEDKLEILSRSKALIFPSNREGWGIPVSEAAYVGTPSIVYNVPGLRDAVDYGNAGFLCDSNTVQGLVQKMNTVVAQQEEYETIRDQAYQFSKNYLNKDIGNELDKFIEHILYGKKC